MNDQALGHSRRKIAVAITLALSILGALLLLAEHDAGARTLRRNANLAWQLPTQPVFPTQLSTPNQLLPTGASEAQVLGFGRQVADSGLAQAQQLVGNQSFAAAIAAFVCPLLQAIRAQVVSQFAALTAQFPQFAAQLIAIRNGALATIDALLAQFGCPVPSGVVAA